MTAKERIHAEIDRVGEDSLDDLYELIRSFVASKATRGNGSIMAKLKGIKIEAPADFAANLDLYLSGEKRVEDSLH